jgi:ABC-type Fe3+/spermidine/putrescine transport system ATPase subunit
MLLEARSITKVFDDTLALQDVTFGATDGEIVSLLGPSGCGKSTLLRVIAGLEQEYRGSVIFDGRSIDAVPVHRRGFGLMFQDFALFPHRSVGENVAFGPRMQGLSRAEIEQRVGETLDLVGLARYRDRSVFELSGGERQRVALARSLAPRPRLLLLDEPLGALDRTLREHLTGELRSIIKRVGITSVYVTHDQVEAFAVADRIALMNAGVIVQTGTPADVYRAPASPFVARFLGLNNLVPGRTVGAQVTPAGMTLTEVQTALGPLFVGLERPLPAGQEVLVVIRPEAAAPAVAVPINQVEGRLVRRTFRGGTERIVLRHAAEIELELDVEAGTIREDGVVRLGLRPGALAIVADPRATAEGR